MAVDKGYVELARLAQSSFDGRRKVEWRINFSLWGALGIVAYWAIKYEIKIFTSEHTACAIGALLIIIYTAALYLIARGHFKDKEFKHYYMHKAEGEEYERKSTPRILPWEQNCWIALYFLFTSALMSYVINILIKDKLCC